MTLHLHCFGESGNAYKAALTLTLCGIDWEPVFVDFFHGATRTPEFRALNVMGEVPVLVGDDVKLTQSGTIQLWAAERTGRLLGPSRAEALRWLLFDNHKVSSQAGALRFHMNFLAPEKRSPQVMDWLSGRLRAALQSMEAQLGQTPWLAGEEVTIGDIACCGYLYYPEPFGFDRAEWPAIDAWLDRISALPGWRHPYDMMPGRPSDRATIS
ncbi:glutathione S-transferase family protein [Rubellimicrobium roseum]|uniref:Glutathione S-transferase n=1 Tax=Rubellimicrobium roseum TaxID=687525 RepID=A0A5C4N9I6_9RHOB|nr:glutathione binding-like protein [Rubellimicrobium roseum]TNC71504.1 glutathione S-transferase [Rubellimicrobium roseum]